MIKRLLNIIELWFWKHNFITIGNIPYFPIGGGKSSAKSSKAEQTAAQQRQEAELKAAEEQRRAALEAESKLIEAGKAAGEEMRIAGEPTAEEIERRERYKAKALTPGETLMMQAGPISQAIARRIQAAIERPIGTYEEGSLLSEVRKRIRERITTPGLDYMTELPAFTEGVSLPLWRALKARGIVPPPGTEGGLATQQFMKGAVPALAELRTRAIAEDIARGEAFGRYEEALTREDIERGERYGMSARELQQLYEEIENTLGEAVRRRQFEAGIRGAEAKQLGTREGAPYQVTGAEAYGRGLTTAASINQAEVQARYARQREEKAAIGKMVAMIVLGAISGGAGAGMSGMNVGAGALAGAAGGGSKALGGGGGADIATQFALAQLLQPPISTPPIIPSTSFRRPSLLEQYESEYALPSALQKRVYMG